MTPVKMEATSDCFQACLASLMDVPLNEAPSLLDHVRQGKVLTVQALTELRGWMKPFGFYPLFMPIYADQDSLARMVCEDWYPGTHAVLSGLTIKGVLHAVIIKDGAVVHDPAPVNQGALFPFPIHKLQVFQLFLVGKII